MSSSSLLNMLRGKLPSYTRKARHLQLLARYATPKKLANIARAELARVRGDITVHSLPYIFTIDTGNVCNLRCPLCPTGYRGMERPQSMMTFDNFRTVLDKVKPYAIEAILHNWGEPFLNGDILRMVDYAKQNRVGTSISSNLNLVNRGDSFLEEVVRSGLEHLTVSVDGTTQEVYETYRKGGDLDHVLRNMRYLIDYRNRTGRTSPQVEWQFLVMKHNEHQIEDARRMGDEIGVDTVRFTGAGLPFDKLTDLKLAKEWISDLPEYRGYAPDKMVERGYLYDEKCFYPYRAMTVNPEGAVSPCCTLYHSHHDFGNLLSFSLSEVWNNAHYRSSRALFSKKPYTPEVETVCGKCPLFKYEQAPAGSS